MPLTQIANLIITKWRTALFVQLKEFDLPNMVFDMIHVGCMSIIPRRLILISSVALFKLLLTIWNFSPSNRLRVHWKCVISIKLLPIHQDGWEERWEAIARIMFDCRVWYYGLWWHCYYTTRSLSRVWSPRDSSSTPVTHVANKLRKVEQLTVCFHLEDCKISHISFLRLRLLMRQ